MAYTTIDKPTDYFNTKLYTGNGTDNHAITGVGFQPDFIWIKARSSAKEHRLQNSVVGITNHMRSNATNSESAGGVKTADSDGFTLGTSLSWNENTTTFASWNWLAGGTASSNSNGNITSSVSVNTTAGISIGTYSSVESNTGKTVGHGLGSKPDMVMVKKRSGVAGWVGWHQGLTGGNEEDRLIALNSTNASNVITDYWGSGFNSTTFGLWDLSGDNSATGDYWFFAFKSVKGYSKFGSYTGNGNADGTFVYTGFKPAWVIIKQSSGSGTSWNIWDNKRLGYNTKNYQLEANTSVVENTSLERLLITSNGFKCLTDNAQINGSGNTYIYMAFAESPFVTSTGIPTTAR